MFWSFENHEDMRESLNSCSNASPLFSFPVPVGFKSYCSARERGQSSQGDCVEEEEEGVNKRKVKKNKIDL